MDRRKSIKALVVGTVSAGVVLEACKDDDKKQGQTPAAENGADAKSFNLDRQPIEK